MFHFGLFRLPLVAGFIAILAVGCSAVPDQTTSNPSSQALPTSELVVYRTPTCGCCGVWVERMQAQGFEIQDNIVENVDGIKAEYGLPSNMQGCHSTVVAGYLVEGHVPAADIQRLLTEKPDIAGIAVPGMPIGSPGMESGDMKEPYAVLTFDQGGNTSVFQEHS